MRTTKTGIVVMGDPPTEPQMIAALERGDIEAHRRLAVEFMDAPKAFTEVPIRRGRMARGASERKAIAETTETV